MRIYFDTNVLVSAVQPDHVHHAQAFAAYVRAQQREIEGHLSNHGLVELYSVLTRAPFLAPVTPREIFTLIQESITPFFHVVGVTTQSHLAAIAMCATAGWKGGRVHDAVHILAAAQAQCELIYTFDVAHFRSLAPEWGERIQAPPRA